MLEQGQPGAQHSKTTTAARMHINMPTACLAAAGDISTERGCTIYFHAIAVTYGGHNHKPLA
jgi:hypothetical protein